jgi:hypothetical protein
LKKKTLTKEEIYRMWSNLQEKYRKMRLPQYLKRTARMKVTAGSMLVNAHPIVGVEFSSPIK